MPEAHPSSAGLCGGGKAIRRGRRLGRAPFPKGVWEEEGGASIVPEEVRDGGFVA